jgi:hypothetical protein
MGYSKTGELGDNFFFGGPFTASYGISTVAADIPLGNITCPVLAGTLKYVYIDLWIGRIHNTNVAANWLHPACNLVARKGGIDSTCLTLVDASCWTDASGVVTGGVFHGQNDVKARFASGQATAIRLDNISSDKDQLVFSDVQPIIRIVME